MKKYVKPEVIIERFELSQQVAACDYDSNNTSTDETCRFTGVNKDFNVEMTIFLSKDNGCSVVADSYCYHNSVAQYGIFNS